MKKVILSLFILSIGIVFIALKLGFWASSFSAIKYSPIERIPLYNVDSKEVTFDSLHGNETVIYFFAGWCRPCFKTLQDLEALKRSKAFKVRLLAVALDNDTESVMNMVLRSGFSGEVWIAHDGTSHLQQRKFGNELRAIPYIVKLDSTTRLMASVYNLKRHDWERVLVTGGCLHC